MQPDEFLTRRLAGVCAQVREWLRGKPAPEWLLAALDELENGLARLAAQAAELGEQNSRMAGAHAAMEAERLRYAELFEYAPDAYLVTNAYGVVQESNHAAGRLFNRPPRLLKGAALVIFFKGEARWDFRDWLAEISQHDPVEEWELQLSRPGGEALRVAIRVTVTRDVEGRPRTLRWLLRDVTRRYRAEEQARRLNADLERRVTERTAELAEANRQKDDLLAREQAARAAAETAAHLRDEFLSVAAHELRTPITTVRGYAQALLRRMDAADGLDVVRARRGVAAIDAQSHKLAVLINQLLDISRIDQGRLILARKQTDVARLAHSVAAEAQVRAPSCSVEVRAPDTLPAYVDELRLEQVLVNLLDNAVRYSPRDRGIEVEVSQPDEHTLYLAVRDHGPGIAPEHREHVFERFYQAQGPSPAGGMGLGLYISRQIVELHGGRIELECPEGDDTGTRVSVTLPVGEED